MSENVGFGDGSIDIRDNDSMLLTEFIKKNSTRYFINLSKIAFKLIMKSIFSLSEIQIVKEIGRRLLTLHKISFFFFSYLIN